jgi:hypothetical protein
MTQRIPVHVERFRELHPTLRYEQCSVSMLPGGLRLDYSFWLTPSRRFTPSITIPCTKEVEIDATTQRLAFLIGMVELMSYWKLSCSPRIEVSAGSLSAQEIEFWEGLFRNGMGEFFYLNQIPPTIEFSIIPSQLSTTPIFDTGHYQAPRENSFLILVGGGKDSVVTLELLKQFSQTRDMELGSFVLNPIPASNEAIHAAQYPPPLAATRRLDPQLLELNAQGYLNGHTPFSALLAFVSTLVAHLNGFRHVLASNESSASEGNVLYGGVEINHQYSKSVHFEEQFRNYMRCMQLGVEYCSFLRPINEVQICALFARFKHQHAVFRSCNREQTLRARARTTTPAETGSKIRGWCAECPKCIFTFLCLSCFLPREEITNIFGVNPSQSPSFISTARELAGCTEHKPFECVGTFEEVRACLTHLFSTKTLQASNNPELAQLDTQIKSTAAGSIEEILARWNTEHFIPRDLVEFLRVHLSNAAERLT